MDAQIVGTLGGALFGFVAAVAPRQLLDFFQRRWLDFRIANRQARLANLVQRAAQEAERALREDPANSERHCTLGTSHLLAGDAEAAVTELEKALLHADAPDEAQVSANLGVALAECQRYEDAARHFAKAATSDGPLGAAAVLNLGLLYRCNGTHTERHARSVVDEGDCPLAHNNRGVYHMRRGDLEEGRAAVERALELRPNYAEARSNLALAEFYQGQPDAALGSAATAAALAPLSAKAHVNLGSFLLLTGNVDAASEALLRATRLAPRSPLAHIGLGLAHLQCDDADGAAPLLRHGTDLAPSNPAAWHNYAIARYRQGDLDAAMRAQQRAADLASDRPSILINLGCYRWEAGDVSGATSNLRTVLELEPDNVEAGRNLGLAMIHAGQYDAAAELFQRLHDHNPVDAALLLGLGVARFISALQDYRPDMHPRDRQIMYTKLYAAFRLFEEALGTENAPRPALLYNMALYHYIRREYEDAEKRLTEAMEFGEDASLLYTLGVVRAEHAVHLRKTHEVAAGELPPPAREKLREAMRDFEKAADLDPDDCDVLCNLGMTAYQLDAFEICARAFRRLSHQERSAEAYNALALVHAKRAKTLQVQARTVTLATETKRASFDREARRLLSTGINCFKEAVQRDNRNPILHSNIGLAYLFRNEADDVRSALAHWQMMRRVGGAWGERQYEILSSLVEAKEQAKAEYNDTEMAFRPIDFRQAARGLSPVPAEVIHVFDDSYDECDWQLVTEDEHIQGALAEVQRLQHLYERRRALSV